MKQAIETADASSPGGAYSQGIRFGVGVVVTAGQVGVDPRTGKLATSFAEQVRTAIANLEAVLAASDLTLADVVKTTCFLANIETFAEFDAIYRDRFGEPFPARSTFGVELAGDILFEIEAWAWRPEK